MADSDFFRESGYGSFLVTGEDVPDDWGENTQHTVNKSSEPLAPRDIIAINDHIWIDRLYAWADENNVDFRWNEDNLYCWGFSRDKNELLNSTYLNLWFGLSELPPEIGHLINLTLINCENNQLIKLPPEIGKLINLTRLELCNNKLTELPKEIGQLKNLEILDLANNNLTELPKEIGLLINLTELNIYGNNFSELPKEIEQLTNLEIFYHDINVTEHPKETDSPEHGHIKSSSLKSHLKVQKKSKPEILNICAVNKKGSTSNPFKIYLTDKSVELDREFVLRLDSAPNMANGSEALRIGNYNLRLIGTHNKAYLEETLKGFRRRGKDGVTYIVVTLHTENIEF